MRFFLTVSTYNCQSITSFPYPHVVYPLDLKDNSYVMISASIGSLLNNANQGILQTTTCILVFGQQLPGINIDVFEFW